MQLLFCHQRFKVFLKGEIFILTQSHIHQIDANNTKALVTVQTALWGIINGAENFDVMTILEVIQDYLKTNEKILNDNL